MATLRFSRVELVTRAMRMDAMVKLLSECFGLRTIARINLLTKSADVKLLQKVKRLQNEALQIQNWITNHIIPMAGTYQSLLLDHDKQIYTLYAPEEVEAIMYQHNYIIEQIRAEVNVIRQTVIEMNQACKAANALTDDRSVLWAYNHTVAPYIEKLRTYSDKIRDIAGLGNN